MIPHFDGFPNLVPILFRPISCALQVSVKVFHSFPLLSNLDRAYINMHNTYLNFSQICYKFYRWNTKLNGSLWRSQEGGGGDFNL